MKQCPYCGTTCKDESQQCPTCHAPLGEETVIPRYAPGNAGGGGAGLAITSMVLGIIAVICNCGLYYIAFPCGVVSIILAAVSLKNDNDGKGMAIAGLVLGIIAVALGVLALIMGGALYIALKNAVNNL